MKKKINYYNSTLYYTIQGKGPTILLLHGYTESRVIWDSFIQSLKKNFTILAPDIAGHGESELNSTEISLDFLADSIVAILQAEKMLSVCIIGHSMGGYIALNIAKRYHSLVNGICLFHSSASSDSDETKKNRERVTEIIRQDKNSFLHSFISDLFATENREILSEAIAKSIKIATSISQNTLIACMNAMKNRDDSLNFLSKTPIPIGFIIGKQDSRIQFDSVLAQTAIPKTSYSLILDNCGHMGYLEKANETLRFVSSFSDICHNLSP